MRNNLPVILVNVSRLTNQIQFPIGLSVIANALKLRGIIPVVIDLIPVAINEREKYFLNHIPDETAIYGFSIVVGNHHLDEVDKIAKLIRQKSPQSIIVYGGSLPSSIPEMVLQNCACDYVVHGEGEKTFPELVKALRKNELFPLGIQGVYFKKDGKVFGMPNKRIGKLDRSSNPDFSFFDMGYYVNYLRETGQSWEIMASRGCRGSCSFCYKFMGNGLSFRSVDHVLDEIEYLIKSFNIPRFYFVDENFLEIKDYFLKFIEKKNKRGLQFTFVAQSRIDVIDEETCKIGSANGLVCISSGIESASQETINRVNKRILIDEVKEKLGLMRRYNIRPAVSFIIGFPWDTEKDYVDMIEFIGSNKLEKHGKLHYLTPLPSTRIFQHLVENGKIKNEFEYIRDLGNLYWQRHINLTDFSDDFLDYYYSIISDLLQRDVPKLENPEYIRKIRKLY